MTIDKWFIYKYAGLGFGFAATLNMHSSGININNLSMLFMGVCLFLSWVVQDVKRKRMTRQ